MKKIHLNHISISIILFMTLSVGLLLVVYGTAQTEITESKMELRVTSNYVTDLSSKAYIVIDLETGTEIISHNSTNTLPIASVTKLFTAAVFKERTGLYGSTTVTWSDVVTEGRSGKLEAGDVYLYNELVQALLVESSNDAATSIARVDTEVLEAMNNYSNNNGYPETSFSDTSGLSPQNVSTAYELAQLTRKLWQEEPYLFDLTRLEQVIGTNTGWINNNPFVGFEGYLGGKHGFTYEAGRTAAAVFSEVISGQDRNFVYVVLGSEDLVKDIEQLRKAVRNNVDVN